MVIFPPSEVSRSVIDKSVGDLFVGMFVDKFVLIIIPYLEHHLSTVGVLVMSGLKFKHKLDEVEVGACVWLYGNFEFAENKLIFSQP